MKTETLIKNAIKKHIKKIVKVNGSHLGVVKRMFEIQFPSYNWNEWIEFTQKEFQKKYQLKNIS